MIIATLRAIPALTSAWPVSTAEKVNLAESAMNPFAMGPWPAEVPIGVPAASEGARGLLGTEVFEL